MIAAMTTASSDDELVSAAVRQLLAYSQETPTDVGHHIGLSTTSVYRKLAGEAKWTARDVGALARHYRLSPGDLYAGAHVPNPFVLPQQRNRRSSDRGRVRRFASSVA